ncbi:hypothetical protein SODALDRAFT_90166 [Sodiomyces alkalinus F11]|uniref:Uncharacterized protein n=1 Tax=Sodiomyces alkalinus (strain CBS 110278 / VKM F-3762 / F11) TaxID=1314773 RepID=A0A3N2Q0M4_SODAK|nr:hypothetical protein SODALDRAFT_90166 [Sodiomyces alkalinus F11]ROT40165.1 hypothetical protein SODALDRAFT_90166 [Sodiomyces alkalinus F11]
MVRDTRRHRGQWRGCYSFEEIICDGGSGDGEKRNGGLKMGHTYYYYYEIDGTYETHDPAMPSTTLCPYLPGQTVNTLEVPMERVLRKRSASLSSLRDINYKTLNPQYKFIALRPQTPLTGRRILRLGSSPPLERQPSSRSGARLPSLRRFLSWRSPTRSGDRPHCAASVGRSISSEVCSDGARSVASSQGKQDWKTFPKSPKRILAQERPASARPIDSIGRSGTCMPGELAADDDDNGEEYITFAMPDDDLYRTSLSSARRTRCCTSAKMPTNTNNAQWILTCPNSLPSHWPPTPWPCTSSRAGNGTSPLSSSTTSSAVPAAEPRSSVEGTPSFCDSRDESEDTTPKDAVLRSHDMSRPRLGQLYLDRNAVALPGYTSPLASTERDCKSGRGSSATPSLADSSALTSRPDAAVALGNGCLLASPVDHGIDDFVDEMSYVFRIIH